MLKQVRGGELVRGMRTVGNGRNLLDLSVTNAVLQRLFRDKHVMKDLKLARLSPQEERFLSLVADGKTNREIGNELSLPKETVKNYVSSILSKLEVARRAEAAATSSAHPHARHARLTGSKGPTPSLTDWPETTAWRRLLPASSRRCSSRPNDLYGRGPRSLPSGGTFLRCCRSGGQAGREGGER